jgi:hypothetical protein
MRRCVGLTSAAYHACHNENCGGAPVSCSPMFHHPNACPFDTDRTVVDCKEHCSNKSCMQRPCNFNHYGNVPR